MDTHVTVTHRSLTLKAGFEDFCGRLESALGRFDAKKMRDLQKEPQSIEAGLKKMEGQEGLMLFDSFDHGGLLALHGRPQKARQYVLGNPLIAAQMTRHDIRAGLYAPLRLFVSEDPRGAVRVDYDLPSSLFGQFRNEAIDAVARTLDIKLDTLIRTCAAA